MSFWIINTYFSLKIFEDLYLKKSIKFSKIIYLSFFTAFLIGIRIVGFLIFIQYLITLIIFLEKTKTPFLKFLKLNFKNISIFIISILLFIIFLNPIFWHNPLEIINSIKWMGKYPQNIGTLDQRFFNVLIEFTIELLFYLAIFQTTNINNYWLLFISASRIKNI